MFQVELITGNEGFDNGVDLEYSGLSIDVKTMGRTTDVKDYYVNNFIALQKKTTRQMYLYSAVIT